MGATVREFGTIPCPGAGGAGGGGLSSPLTSGRSRGGCAGREPVVRSVWPAGCLPLILGGTTSSPSGPWQGWRTTTAGRIASVAPPLRWDAHTDMHLPPSPQRKCPRHVAGHFLHRLRDPGAPPSLWPNWRRSPPRCTRRPGGVGARSVGCAGAGPGSRGGGERCRKRRRPGIARASPPGRLRTIPMSEWTSGGGRLRGRRPGAGLSGGRLAGWGPPVRRLPPLLRPGLPWTPCGPGVGPWCRVASPTGGPT